MTRSTDDRGAGRRGFLRRICGGAAALVAARGAEAGEAPTEVPKASSGLPTIQLGPTG
jgi:hypothetical protein